jgi:hypothetical protein
MVQETQLVAAPTVSRATVTGIRGSNVLLLLDGIEREAELALAYPYAPAVGNEVLALCGEKAWIVGVLRGDNAMTFNVNGALTIEASGPVKIVSHESLEFQAPLCRVNALRLETLAQVAVQKVGESYTWVRGLFQVFAGRHRTVVEEDAVLRAKYVRQLAEKDVKIDGEQIKLG